VPKVLTQEQVEQFTRDNFLASVDVLTPDEARHYRRCLETYEAEQGGAPLNPALSRKVHIREQWAAELVRHPRVLDAVEDLIGPDILVYTTTLFTKEAGGIQVTGWHQDATYLGLQPYEHINVWIALSEASEAAGCMRFVVASSGLGQLRHGAQNMPGSVNHGAQAIVENVPLEHVQSAPLGIGQLSFHHTLAVHSSEPNRSGDRRIGFSLSVIPTRVRHTGSYRMGATLVRGEDRYGHFDLEPDPRAHDADTNASNYAACYGRYRQGYEEQIARHLLSQATVS
jgi:non-heme Fe2+,alpha-ketoglutarate-dependent halogenase